MKLSLANIKNIMDRCTKKEIDLIIHIGQFQDDYGVIKGIDYKDVLKSIGICKSTFYKLLYGLEEKEIIKINYFSDYGYWEVMILNNAFANQGDYAKGYLKLNYEILHTQEFKGFTKGEKLIVLHLLLINDYRKSKVRITFAKMMEWTGKSLRSVRKFIQTLSSVLHIIVEDGLCLFDAIAGLESRTDSETDIRNKHLILYRLKKAKFTAEEKAIKDTITVFKQYKINCVDTMIELLDRTLQNFGTLMPKYINKLAAMR